MLISQAPYRFVLHIVMQTTKTPLIFTTYRSNFQLQVGRHVAGMTPLERRKEKVDWSTLTGYKSFCEPDTDGFQSLGLTLRSAELAFRADRSITDALAVTLVFDLHTGFILQAPDADALDASALSD